MSKTLLAPSFLTPSLLAKTVLVLSITAAMLAGCRKHEDAADTTPVEPASAPAAETAPQAAQAPAAAPTASVFDIGSIPVSDKPLPAWPYLALPAGYHYYGADNMAARSKDLARVPVWTGGQLLWVEGKVFSDSIRNDDGKTYSKFEVRKSLQQAVEALGGVRVSERSFDASVWKANEKELNDFRQEFDRVQNAYWYDNDADTYVIHRADKAIWVVLDSGNDQAGVLVAEGPLPPPPAK